MLRALNTLLGRTAIVVISAFILFSILALSVTRQYLLEPLQERAAEDLSGLLVLSAQVWVELPPWTRLDYQAVLQREHGLLIADAVQELPLIEKKDQYLKLVEQSLTGKTRQPILLRFDAERPDWTWADIDLGPRIVRIGFSRDRLRYRLPKAVLAIGGTGSLIILITTLLLARHLARPLARLTQAVQQISKTGQFRPLEEKGPAELAILAHRINLAEREIQTLLNNRTTLLAGISHDLRTPLTRMQLELALLDPDTPREQVESLNAEIDTMNQLVAQTLELARGLGKHEQPDQSLPELLDSLQQAYERDRAPVDFSVDPACEQLVPSAPLKRVLDNLIGNALRHSGNEPVTVSAECGVAGAVVAVVDQGPGIPPALREQVFTPFFRVEDSRNPETGGSGLGLAIVRQLCDFYHWRIMLADAEGGGLAVRLEIPPAAVPRPAETT